MLDWDVTPTVEAVARFKLIINRAYQQLMLDAPFLFWETTIRFATQPDVESLSSFDYLSAINPDDIGTSTSTSVWVMRGAFEADSDADNFASLRRDRSWDGRSIILYSPGEIPHKNQLRSIWIEEVSGTDYYHVSLVKPWPASRYGAVAESWRIFTDTYWLPDDVVEVKSMRIVGVAYPTPLQFIGQSEAEERGFIDDDGNTEGGVPQFVYRHGHYQLPGPNVAPTVTAGTLNNPDEQWLGPEPFGEFEYCVTYTWGKRDLDYQNEGIHHWDSASTGDDYEESSGEVSTLIAEPRAWGQNRSREPLFESAPSPISTAITVASEDGDPLDFAKAPILTLPNIEYQLGMMLSGLTDSSDAFRRRSTSHSGIHVRVYRRRLSEDYTDYDSLGTAAAGDLGTHIPSLRKLDIHDGFYLLAEVRIEDWVDGNLTGNHFVDRGNMIPDQRRPLRDTHGYQGIRFYPMPDDRYEVEVRCMRRPPKLVSDTDVPRIHAEACEALLMYASSLVKGGTLKDTAGAAADRVDYHNLLRTLGKRYGDIRPADTPVQKRFASTRRYNRTNNPWWRIP